MKNSSIVSNLNNSRTMVTITPTTDHAKYSIKKTVQQSIFKALIAVAVRDLTAKLNSLTLPR